MNINNTRNSRKRNILLYFYNKAKIVCWRTVQLMFVSFSAFFVVFFSCFLLEKNVKKAMALQISVKKFQHQNDFLFWDTKQQKQLSRWIINRKKEMYSDFAQKPFPLFFSFKVFVVYAHTFVFQRSPLKTLL